MSRLASQIAEHVRSVLPGLANGAASYKRAGIALVLRRTGTLGRGLGRVMGLVSSPTACGGQVVLEAPAGLRPPSA